MLNNIFICYFIISLIIFLFVVFVKTTEDKYHYDGEFRDILMMIFLWPLYILLTIMLLIIAFIHGIWQILFEK